VEETAERTVRARWAVVPGIDVIADGQSHHRSTDVVRRQRSIERQEGVGLDI
jgi:hypothetical protein